MWKWVGRIGLAALSLCFLAGAIPLSAQGGQGYISGWAAEIIFPQAIRFQLWTLYPLADLRSATLTIQPDGLPETEISIAPGEAAVVSQPYTELAYIWNFSEVSRPRLFAPIRFRWDVMTVDNQPASLTAGLIFSDPRSNWQQSADPQGRINLTAPDNSVNPDGLRRDLRTVYALLAANTGQSPAFNFILYPRQPGCSQNTQGLPVAVGMVSGITIPCDPALAEAVFRLSGYEPVVNLNGGWLEAIVEHLVRGFYQPFWTEATPKWFQVGLGAFYSPSFKGALLSQAQSAAQMGALYRLDQMDAAPPDDNGLWRAQSYGMVAYIAWKMGLPGLFALAKNAGSDFAGAYQTAAGEALAALLPGWERWIFTDEAAAVYNFTPYQPTTPTPTPTLTPTVTPSATVPPTATLTPSVTLAPTETPTRTPTPSVTPRPPGSLHVATPTPTIAPGENSSLGVGGLVIAGFLALAGLMAYYWRRR